MPETVSLLVSFLAPLISAIFAIITIYITARSEKNKIRYARMQDKREASFEVFIEHFMKIIADPECVFEEEYISTLVTHQAKVLLYSNKRLFEQVNDLVIKCQDCLNSYQQAHVDNKWNVYQRAIADDLEDMNEKQQEIELEKKEYKNTHKLNSVEIRKSINEICHEMQKVLQRIK